MTTSRDQLDADAKAICDKIKAATNVSVVVNFDQVLQMHAELRKTLRAGIITDQDEITEVVLGKYNLGDEERAAYLLLLTKLEHRWLGAKSSRNSKGGKFAPFAPLSAYEEDFRAGRLR